MQKNKFITAIILLVVYTSCVQKSYKKTVVANLVVQNQQNIKTVGVRGTGSPLSWDKDLPMKEVVKDSLYTVTVTAVTGYKFAEIKFVVNDEFELNNQPNRRVVFSEGDTTVYNAVYNIVNK
jgi:hypothetical protein